MQRALLLAVLLHVWLVLVFGNATGTAAPGEGVWGSLTVKLTGRSGGEPGAPPGEPNRGWRDNGAPGSGDPQRQGGQLRPEAPTTQDTGAAALGRWNPQEVAPEAARTEDLSDAPPSTATLALPPGFKPIERESLAKPAARTTPLTEPSADLPAAVGRLESRQDAKAAPLPSPDSLRTPAPPVQVPSLQAELPAPVSRLDAAPSPDRTATLPRPNDLRALPAPAPAATPTADLPATVQRLEAPATPNAAAALPRPAELRAAPRAAVEALPNSSPLPSAVQRLDNAATTAAVTPLSRASDLRAPSTSSATTSASALGGSQDLPSPVRRLESADSAGSVTPLQPAASPRANLATSASTALPELSTALPGQVNAPAGPARGDPTADPSAAAAAKASAGSPDAGSRLGADVAVPPSASASAPRAPLNLSLPRSGDIAARRGPGLVELLPQPPERKSKLEQSLEDAANKDCRKAYANAGILAAIPLAVDAARGKGCKW